MGLANTIRNVIAIADRITTDLQVPVQHYAWIRNDLEYSDKSIYAAPITRLAIVNRRERLFRFEGQDLIQRASVIFLRPITANGATGRREPVDPRDKIVLPDGYTGPIRDVRGLENTFSDSPYMLEVILG